MSQPRSVGGLIDFSQLRRKNQDYNTYVSKGSAVSNGVDLNLDSNEDILRSFKELRDKLKHSNRENGQLRDQMNSLHVQLKQLLESQKNLVNINHQLKQRNQSMQQSNDELKKKLIMSKEQSLDREEIKAQLTLAKQHLIDIKNRNQILQNEKKKVMQISIEDKMILEEKLNKIQLKQQNDEQYLSQIQSQLCKAKETILKQQNALKKLQIKYDQEIFNKQWSKENFQKQHYQKKISQLECALSQCKTKNKKQRQKREDLERRLLQIQQITGLCSVKAQVYEGQVELMTKKIKKMERRVSQAKESASKMANQKTNWEQKFIKSSSICEELINRIKRQVVGDMVQLAKTCQYRLNKLRQNKESDKKQFYKTQRLSKKNKTQRKRKNTIDKQNATSTKKLQTEELESQSYTGKVLFQHNSNKIQEPSLKQNNPSQYNNIDLRIRKERDEMQKRLKEKMLYRQIEVSNSPNKSKLREEYLKQMLQR